MRIFVSSEDKQPIPGARLLLINPILQDTTRTLTDINGSAGVDIRVDSLFCCITAYAFADTCFWLNDLDSMLVTLYYLDQELSTVVVSAQYEPGAKTNSMHSIAVVSHEQLQSQSLLNAQDVLNSQVNFQTNNGHTNETALTINGLSGAHVKIMLDGVPLEGRINGNIDLSQINLADVERVEIIEGPVSVVYGSNALGGIVNIISRKSTSKPVEGFAQGYYESAGKYNFNGGLSVSKKNSVYRVSLGRNFFDGYAENDSLRSFLWQPREQYFARFTYRQRLNNFNLSFSADGFHELMVSKGDLRPPYYTTAIDTYYKTNRIATSVLFNGKPTSNTWLDITLGHSYFNRCRNIYFKDLTTLDKWLTDGESDQDTTTHQTYMMRSFFSHRLKNEKLSWLAGTEWVYNTIHSVRILNRIQWSADVAVFASLKYSPFKTFTLQPGVRYSYNACYKTPVLPSLIAKISFKKFSITASYARGFRTPDLKERFLEFHYNSSINIYGNNELIPENSHHLLLELSQKFSQKSANQKIRLTLFHNTVMDIIDVVQLNADEWKYDNAGLFVACGSTINFSGNVQSFLFDAGYTLLASRFGNAYTEGHYAPFALSQNCLITLGYEIKKMQFAAHVSWKYTGRVSSNYYDENMQIQQSFIGDYQLLNLTLTKKFLGQKILVSAGCKNITNTTTADVKGSVFGYSVSEESGNVAVMWGRSYFVSILLKL
ncbi:MAG: TonB-dependent receptor [Crocinitomicaceae bacterium]|nr:TonB-dependent receptor [Crocinitomicaceae bacterium]